MVDKDSKIILVGSGVFGLSNALHLASNGYKNVTVFDRLDLEAQRFTLLNGSDTASADINKVFRAQYAEKKHYQDLAFQAFEVWQKWNSDIQLLPEEEKNKFTDLKLLDLCGYMKLDDIDGWEEKKSRENFVREGLGSLNIDISNENDVKRAKYLGLGNKINFALNLKKKYPEIQGTLDLTAGVLYASRTLQYAFYLCKKLGVKFVLGGDKGTFQDFIYKFENVVNGIKTKDGKEHLADLVVVNAGPWTTKLVPELDGINEAAAGNILIAKIPKDRKDLFIKYNSKNFPMFGWKNGHSREHDHMGGMFLFPTMEPEGYLKIIVRQTKYTNPVVTENNQVISVPKTKNSLPPFHYLPKHITNQVKEFLNTFFPDLKGLKWESRILWYTDTINNDYIYDYVPGKKNLFVACGGSGHAFKMLPVLGQFLVDKIEKRENFYTNLFSWKNHTEFKGDPNGLQEKLNSSRAYDKQIISDAKDYNFSDDVKPKL